MSPEAQFLKSGHYALGTAGNESGAQNIKTGLDDLGTAENDTGTAENEFRCVKPEKGTRRPRNRRR
jgi:hypothetical protein